MRPLNDYFLTVDVTDVSTGTPGYVVAPDAGRIIKVLSVVHGTTNGVAVMTISVDGTDITETLTIASGAVAGEVDSVDIPTEGAVNAGSAIAVTSNGGGTTAVLGRFTLVIRR